MNMTPQEIHDKIHEGENHQAASGLLSQRLNELFNSFDYCMSTQDGPKNICARCLTIEVFITTTVNLLSRVPEENQAEVYEALAKHLKSAPGLLASVETEGSA
jgi:hypothetical protein